MANEPSLGELSITPPDVAPAPIIDNTPLVNQLNQNARFNAENVWRQYNAFLENKKELFKNIGDVQGLDTLPEDNEVLRKEAGDILSKILKDPSIALGGKGYNEVQADIAKFRSNAMASKQYHLDDKANRLAIDRMPELRSDENMAKLQAERTKPISARKSVMLDLPAIFDEKGAFSDIKTAATQPYTALVDKTGQPGEGYIETGNEVNPTAILGLWNMASKGQKDKYGRSIMAAIKNNYDNDDAKAKYEAEGGGGIEKYFADRGQQYLDAYFPEGSYEKTKEGNYRFGKKLVADPNYLGAERLAQKTVDDAEELRLKWAKYWQDQDKLDKVDDEDLISADAVINEATSIINSGQPRRTVDPDGKNPKDVLRISDPTLLQTFGNIDKEGRTTNVPDGINFDPKTEQLSLLYFKPKGVDENGNPVDDKSGKEVYTRVIPLDKRTWLKYITKRSFPNKDIGGVNTLIEKLLKANGDKLTNISKKNTAPAAAPATKKVTSKGLPIIGQ